MNNKEHPQKDAWDKVAAASALIASLLVPIAAIVVGNNYAQSLKDSENNIKYLEIAISVLRSEPKDEAEELRNWAVDVLAKHSPVPLSPIAQTGLKTHRAPPGFGWVEQDPSEYVGSPRISGTNYPDGATVHGVVKNQSPPAASSTK